MDFGCTDPQQCKGIAILEILVVLCEYSNPSIFIYSRHFTRPIVGSDIIRRGSWGVRPSKPISVGCSCGPFACDLPLKVTSLHLKCAGHFEWSKASVETCSELVIAWFAFEEMSS